MKHLYDRIKLRYFENKINDLYDEILELHKDILEIPVIDNAEDITKISQLIITTQLNSMKCLSCQNVWYIYIYIYI